MAEQQASAGAQPRAWVVEVATADQMKALGRRLGKLMSVGDVVGLVGTLGAGKTTLAQGIAEGLEVTRERHVASPTFALVNEHPGRVPFVHADLYRLSKVGELAELGLEEIFDRAATVIEWADLFPTALPHDHLRVDIAFRPGEGRTLSFSAAGPISRGLADGLVAASTVAETSAATTDRRPAR